MCIYLIVLPNFNQACTWFAADKPFIKRTCYCYVTCIAPLRRWLHLRFDCNSNALQPFDDLAAAAALRVSVTARLAGYVAVTLVTFDKQSNVRRTPVESKSNRRTAVMLTRTGHARTRTR